MNRLDKLIELFNVYGMMEEDIQIATKSDLIILRDESKFSVPFEDTGYTLSAKKKLIHVNELLSHHSIVLPSGRPIHRKFMHRVFNRDFQHGGRFYGPEWQSMNEDERSRLITDGSPVVELDFQSLHPTILYALSGEQLDEDPYSFSGYSPNVRGFLKIVMLVLINTGDEARARKAL
jgi:hypothetical protein